MLHAERIEGEPIDARIPRIPLRLDEQVVDARHAPVDAAKRRPARLTGGQLHRFTLNWRLKTDNSGDGGAFMGRTGSF
jgi:hypothetical protein